MDSLVYSRARSEKCQKGTQSLLQISTPANPRTSIREYEKRGGRGVVFVSFVLAMLVILSVSYVP